MAPEGVLIAGNTPCRSTRSAAAGLEAGDLYVASHLDATVGALVRLYRTKGFRRVAVKSAETEAGGDAAAALLRPGIVISEGPRAVLAEVTVSGAKALSEAEIRRTLQLQIGQPYYEPSITAARDAVQLEYLNLGFSNAQVTLTPSLSEDRTRVSLGIAIAKESRRWSIM